MLKKTAITILCIFLAIVIIAGGGLVYFINTPEYALLKICSDMKEIGFDAVLNNLTSKAYEKIEPIVRIVDNGMVKTLLSLISDKDYASILIQKASEVEWSVGDILKNNRKANVTVGFNYEDMIIGTIDIELLKEDGEWKINNLHNLQIDKISLKN